jgi:DNA polymerase-1
MGVSKLARDLNVSDDQARGLFDRFDRSVPFVRELADLCNSKAQQRGWIRTLFGRKRHFNFWEPVGAMDMRRQGLDVRPRRREEAVAMWPHKRLVRGFTHKSLNALIQGSAADMVKVMIIRVWEQEKKVPMLAVHDETDYATGSDAEHGRIKKVGETWDNITVPMKIDDYRGGHWK